MLGLGMLGLVAACSSTTTDPGGASGSSGTLASGSTGSTGGPTLDPCSLLTHEQVSQITDEPNDQNIHRGENCLFGHKNNPGDFISIDVWPKDGYDREANRVVPTGATQTEVDGVGDAAISIDAGPPGPILWFRKGDLAFEVDVVAVRGPLEGLDAEKQIAQYVIQKL